MTTCTRFRCTKTLRANNTKGVCSTNCESPDAPVFARAAGVKVFKISDHPPKEPSTTSALDRFRAVHKAMGIDPEPVLEEFCNEWLGTIRSALES